MALKFKKDIIINCIRTGTIGSIQKCSFDIIIQYYICILIFTIIGIIVGISLPIFHDSIYDNNNTSNNNNTNTILNKYIITVPICTVVSNFFGFIFFTVTKKIRNKNNYSILINEYTDTINV